MAVTGAVQSAPKGEIVAWAAVSAVAAAIWGMDWLGTTVEVPLVGILILTFIPTMDLIDLTRTAINRLEERIESGEYEQ